MSRGVRTPGPKRGRSRAQRIAAAVLAVLATIAIVALRDRLPAPVGEGASALPPASSAPVPSGGARDAFAARANDLPLVVEGRVERILPDDRDGSRHQRFVIELPDGMTLLVAHNIDLAPRVPVERGDAVVVDGVYEWNERGGVMHWTHHDPRGERAGGRIEHEGRVYR